MMIAPTLVTDRLVLRHPEKDDAEASFALWSDPATVRFIGGKPSDRQDAWLRFLRYPGLWSYLGYGYWVATRRSDGAFVGEIGFGEFGRGLAADFSDRPEAGWVIRPDMAGQGFATEGVRAILSWVDSERPEYADTVCMIEVGNTASERVAEKVGYRPYGQTIYQGSEVALYRRMRG